MFPQEGAFIVRYDTGGTKVVLMIITEAQGGFWHSYLGGHSGVKEQG